MRLLENQWHCRPHYLIGVLSILVLLSFASRPAAAQDLNGSWSGRWQSRANGHSGRLNASFCQVSANQMSARFHGTFAKIIPFRYRAKLNIVYQQSGLTVLAGSRRLPLAGQFSYYAELTDGCFQGTFASPRNQGSWSLSRR